MFCPNCGKECMGMNFCPQCGQKLADGGESVFNTFPEPGTAAFEAKRAELKRRQIPHCPECLSTHVTALIWASGQGGSFPYDTRFVCLWCTYEWHPKRKKFTEPFFDWKKEK